LVGASLAVGEEHEWCEIVLGFAVGEVAKEDHDCEEAGDEDEGDIKHHIFEGVEGLELESDVAAHIVCCGFDHFDEVDAGQMDVFDHTQIASAEDLSDMSQHKIDQFDKDSLELSALEGNCVLSVLKNSISS
jgi:hypothetical protein